jgi:lipopolysaccharide/colanic/teichoic acid biosynthesis glycosyltransferase
MPRAADLLISLAALLLLAPVLLLVAVAVRICLGAPVLFRQRRSGRDARAFEMPKFRSMTDARDRSGSLLPDAERLTRLGRFLRRSRLDELPGLTSIVRGDMALVGPRPLLPETIAAMGEAGRRRGAVRPGLTGWAQVNGNALLSNEDKLSLDLWYIANRSLGLDLAIIFRTLWVVAAGERINPANLENAVAGNPYRRC